MVKSLGVITLLSLAAAAAAQQSVSGWDGNNGESFDDHVEKGAEDVGSVVGDAASLVTEIATDAFVVATTVGGAVYTIMADSVEGLENALEAMGDGFESGFDEGYHGNSTKSPSSALGIQPWSISYPLIATCAAAIGGAFVGAFAVL